MTTLKIDLQEKKRLNDHIKKIEKNLFLLSAGALAVGLLFAVFKTTVIKGGELSTYSIMLSILMLSVIYGAMVLWALSSYKYWDLKKDAISKTKIKLDITIVKIETKEGNGDPEVEIHFKPSYKGRSKIDCPARHFSDFVGWYRGQPMELTVTSHALYLLQVVQKKVKPVKGIQDALNLMDDILKSDKSKR